MEYSISGIVKSVGKSQRKPLRVAVGVSSTGNGNGIGLSSHPSFKNVGVCQKCGCKKRHARTCPLKNKGEDEEELIYTSKETVVQKIETMPISSTNAGSLFCYLDVAALKRYKKHYRLKTRHNSTKAELANAVRMHFENINVNEFEVIDIFLMKVKTTGGPNGSPS